MTDLNRELYEAVRAEYMKQVTEGVTVKNEDGDVMVISPDYKLLQSATGFLKAFGAGDDKVEKDDELSKALEHYGDKVVPFKARG